MLTLTITTSAQTITYMLDVPVNDKIALHYDECNYCDTEPVRRERICMDHQEHRFCKPSHRVSFSQKGIAKLLTATS